MTEKKAVFFDIDGTLILEKPFPFAEDIEAMEEAAAKGHFLFLNTGRSFANIPLPLLELPAIAGIAAGGGAHILLAGKTPGGGRYRTVYRRFIPEDFLKEICAFYLKNPRCCFLEGERDCYTVNRPSRLGTVKPSVPVDSPDELAGKIAGDFITKLTIEGFVSEEEGLLLETLLKLNLFHDYTEGIIKGENKAKAMEFILRELGIGRENSVAVGDGANDLDMIRFAGLGIAVGNARAELKAAAGAITGECGKGGVAQALRNFVL